jgi:HEAT repeat protein
MKLTIKQLFTLLLVGILLTGCAIRQTPYSLEDVEKHRLKFKQGKRKSLQILINIYQDQNQTLNVRIEALHALAESRHPNVISAIQSSVKNASLIEMNLMHQSIDILTRYDISSSADSLVIGLKNTEMKVMDIRESIVNAIGENGTEDEIITLLELYEVSRSNHARMNKLMTLTLGGMTDDRAIPILMDIANNIEMDVHIRNRAVEILARKESPELVDFFIEMLGDPTHRDKVNEYALNVLGEQKDDRMVFALLEAYQTGKHEYYALMNTLIKSLSDYKNPAIKPVFMDIAVTDGFPKTLRIKAIRALAGFDDPSVVDDVIAILYYPSNYIYYNEIVSMIKELGQYEKYRAKLRNAAYEAMQRDVNGDDS